MDGVGGVGGYFGGRLAQAGYPVTMVSRGRHLKAIQKEGLIVESAKGDFKVFPKMATNDLSQVAQPDVVILGVKSWQLEEVAEKLKAVIGEDTMILPLQNGADNVEKLLKIFPEKNVLAGLCRVVSFIAAPGKIKHTSYEPQITFGEIDNSKSQRIAKLQEAFRLAGINNTIPDNVQLEIWKKFLFITTVSGIGGLIRVPIGKIRESDYLYELMRKTALEILEIAKAKNIALTRGHLNEAFEIINKQPAEITASAQRDIMAGKPSELESFNGYVVKEGKRLGIPTPTNLLIYECLLPMEQEARLKQNDQA